MASKATIQLDVISCFFVSEVRKKKSSYRIKKNESFITVIMSVDGVTFAL
jgi:hypothetical protein